MKNKLTGLLTILAVLTVLLCLSTTAGATETVTDAFGRPLNAEPTLTYTEGVSYHQLYVDLGKVAATDLTATATCYVDGVQNPYGKETEVMSNLKAGVKDSYIGGQGVLTEVYFDSEEKTLRIVEINTYVGRISMVKDAIIGSDGEVTRETFVEINLTGSYPLPLSFHPVGGAITADGVEQAARTIITDEFSIEDIYDTIVYYTMGVVDTDEDGVGDTAKVQTVTRASVVSGRLDGCYSESNRITEVTVGDKTIKTNVKCWNDFGSMSTSNFWKLFSTGVNVHMDAYGNVIYLSLSEEYALLLSLERKDESAGAVYAKLLFEDGTIKDVELYTPYEIGGTDIYNALGLTRYMTVRYTVEDDGTYSINAAAYTGTVTNKDSAGKWTVYNKKPLLDGQYYADEHTVFVLGESEANGITAYKTYTGISSIPTFHCEKTSKIYFAVDELGKVPAVFCTNAVIGEVIEDEPVTGRETICLIKTGRESVWAMSASNQFYPVLAGIDGEIITVKVARSAFEKLLQVGFNVYSDAVVDGNGNYSEFLIAPGAIHGFIPMGFRPYEAGVVAFTNNDVRCVAPDVPVYLWDAPTRELQTCSITSVYPSEVVSYYTTDSLGNVTAVYLTFDQIYYSGDMEVQSVLVEGNDLHFYISKEPEWLTSTKISITWIGTDGRVTTKTIPFKAWEDYNDRLYRVTYSGMEPKRVSDTIYVTIAVHNNYFYHLEITGRWTGSVRDCVKTQIANAAGAAEKNRLVAAMDYSAAAQDYFEYEGVSAAADLEAEIAAMRENFAEELSTHRKDDSFVSGKDISMIYGTSVVHEVNPQLKFYFTTNDKAVFVNGDEATLQASSTEGYYYCLVDVAPEDIFETVTVEVKDGETTLATITDSVASYCARLYAMGGEKNETLADALLNYGLACKAAEA